MPIKSRDASSNPHDPNTRSGRISPLVLSLGLVIGSIAASHSAAAADSTADFYVSPIGSDDWSGTLAEPNADQSDGPFATIARARDAIRSMPEIRSRDLIVLIRGGTYRISETIVFGLQDSGDDDSSITYAAYPNETPILSAGIEITNWQRPDDMPGLPAAARGKVRVANTKGQFKALFDQNGLLPRARSKGFIPPKHGNRDTLHFPAGRLQSWPNVEDVEIIVRPHHAWIVNVLPLKSVDTNQQIAKTSIAATYAIKPLHFLKQTESCWVENALEELDEPGEWALNTKEGKLYLWPRDESPAVAPQLTELIRIEGKIDKQGPTDNPVRNLHFRGLTLMHGDRYTINANDAGLQHDWEMHDKASALVRLRGTENCGTHECRFAHTGGGAIRVDLHGQQNEISGNLIEHIGGSGVLLCGYGPGTKDVNKNNVVFNNHIHHTGQIYSHSPGIMVWQSGENRVANNLIHHTPYTAIIISGCMADFFARGGRELSKTIRRHEIKGKPKRPKREEVVEYLHTRNNLIERNEIHHAMESLGDGNGIYIRGAGGGNIIRRNYIHHLVAPMKMQAAIRTDGGQRDTLIAENLIYKCMAQGIILKLNNRCENNIIADIIAPPRGYYLAVREGPMTGATIKRNIFYSSSANCKFIDELPPRGDNATEDRRGRALALSSQAETDQNVYYCASNAELGVQMLQNQRRDGVDKHSLAVDPLFQDALNGDFRFSPDSALPRMGFVPIGKTKFGLVTP